LLVDLLCLRVGVVDTEYPHRRQGQEADEQKHQKEVHYLDCKEENRLPDLSVVQLPGARDDERQDRRDGGVFFISTLWWGLLALWWGLPTSLRRALLPSLGILSLPTLLVSALLALALWLPGALSWRLSRPTLWLARLARR
jgi:hypothetical protein